MAMNPGWNKASVRVNVSTLYV